jgi:hypothetical protein
MRLHTASSSLTCVFIRNIHTPLKQNRLLAVIVPTSILHVRHRVLIHLIHLVKGRQCKALGLVTRGLECVAREFGAVAAKCTRRVLVREAARASASRGRFSDETGREVLNEAAQGRKAAAHDEQVCLNETVARRQSGMHGATLIEDWVLTSTAILLQRPMFDPL